MHKKPWIIVAGITLLGLLLRFFILSQRGSLWFDEAFSVHFASMDLGKMLSYLRFENNPPLYFILLHFWIKLFGVSELAVRSLSLIFGLASIPLIYMLGRRLHSQTAGLFASFLLAVSSFTIFYSTETRMYGLYLFLSILVAYLFLTILTIKKSGVSSFCLFFALLIFTWTHITAWLIILAFILFLFWQSKFRLRQFLIHNSAFLIPAALAALLFLPWALPFLREKIIAPASQGWFFYLPPDKNFFLHILESFLAFNEENSFIITLLSIVIFALVFFALQKSAAGDPAEEARRPPPQIPQPPQRLAGGEEERGREQFVPRQQETERVPKQGRLQRSPPYLFLLFWLLIPLLVGFALSSGVLRYFIAVAPAFYLMLGIGFSRAEDFLRPQAIFRRTFGMKMTGLITLLIFMLILPSTFNLTQIAHHRWNELAQWIKQNEKDNTIILVNPHSEILPFERYYRGTLPVHGFYPREDEDDRDLRIVKTNWLSIVTKENVRRLADLTEGSKRVFLVRGEVDTTSARNLTPLWFWENGWRPAETEEFGRISVILLEKIAR